MTTFKIAHIHEQGIDIIITPLESSFGHKTEHEQSEIITSLQICARSAGLAGTVVPVWLEGGSHKFIAPQQWHPFFNTFGWNRIMANINKELTCG